MAKGRDDNLSPSGLWFKHMTQKGTVNCNKSFKAPSLSPLGLCMSSVHSKTGRKTLKSGCLASSFSISTY